MNSAAAASEPSACRICSHTEPSGESATCPRCGHHEFHFKNSSSQLTLAFALTALILYLPANIFPFMTMELYGRRTSATIWGGTVSLVESGSYTIAAVIFLASMVVPFVKLAILFYLAIPPRTQVQQKRMTKMYFFVEAIGRWSMLDIFLLAVLVAMMKLSTWTTVEPELGSALFALVVIFTMLASAFFNPKLIWEKRHET